jgi:hypothetical protein
MAGVVNNEYDEPKFSFLTAGVGNKESKAALFHQQQNGYVPNSWIVLDNQSTVNVFSNEKLLKNLRGMDRVMNIRSNIRVTCTNLTGDLPRYNGEVCTTQRGSQTFYCNPTSRSTTKSHMTASPISFHHAHRKNLTWGWNYSGLRNTAETKKWDQG